MLLDQDIHRHCIQFNRKRCGRQTWAEVRYQDKPYKYPDGIIRTLCDDSVYLGEVYRTPVGYRAEIQGSTGHGKTRLKAVDDALRRIGR